MKGIDRDNNKAGVTIAGKDLADTVDVMIELIRSQFKMISMSESYFSIVVEFLWRKKKLLGVILTTVLSMTLKRRIDSSKPFRTVT